ncbi:vasoactive intestinal polypeptide receptor 1 isoform X5 [Pan paniscus]|uniref:vasoactive intestinal polypeptide receptor 1 isoform X5 n=1 Tax=Pan paniscus TaxID=9597 RepID=UPI0004F0A061|nr:vasoactive intestinal polypeptide receptor 1 isoform X7 [Pan paniscus]XP_016796319.1 vasoactive intestinal polypeptide receptor 1 isoform X7 [Pan troglodytes]
MRPPSPLPARWLCVLAGALACALGPAGGQAARLQEECDYVQMIEVQHKQCLEEAQLENETIGCSKMWDNLTCWPATPRGQVVVLACPLIFKLFSPIQGRNVSRSCTDEGWTHLEPGPYPIACGLDDKAASLDEQQTMFYGSVKTGYTIGYGLSLATLLVATAILSLFRWAVRQPWSFSNIVSWPTSSGCWWRASTCTPCLPSPSSLSGSTSGGVPSTFTMVWTIARIHFEDYGCWDTINSSLWWIIKGPILTSILVNFILFICIIRILLQKLRPPDIRKSDSSPYSRLARSTLLLIPLFGVHYIMFAFFPDNFKPEVKMVFELVVGSFQGFVVAILYCFLNGEVQAELRRKWRRWHLQGVLGWNPKYRHPSGGSNGATCSTQVSMLTRVSPGARRSSSFQAEVSLV